MLGNFRSDPSDASPAGRALHLLWQRISAGLPSAGIRRDAFQRYLPTTSNCGRKGMRMATVVPFPNFPTHLQALTAATLLVTDSAICF
jgi:hypothetical protein